MANQTTGVKFLLGISDQERRAIQLVDLFMDYAEVSCVYRGEGPMTIHVRELHMGFHSFIKRLQFSDPLKHTFFEEVNGECLAVTLYDRAFADPRGRTIAHIVDYNPRELGNELTELERRAHDIGISSYIRGIDILTYVNLSLEKMGSL
jgi:hypothetical protein